MARKTDLKKWAEEPTEPGKEQVRLERAVRRAEQKARELDRMKKALADELEIAEERLDVALSISEPKQPRPLKRAKRGPRTSHEAVAHIMGSDWHVEETVDPRTVSGVNEFNLEIADIRLGRFWRRAGKLVEMCRGPVDIRQAVVGLLGDHMSGFIHEELMEMNQLSPTETVLWLQPRIIQGIQHLLGPIGLERIDVVCCYGNHGRTNPHKKISSGYRNSFEWLMYCSLKQFFETDERVTFHIAHGPLLYHQVFDWTTRYCHGDPIRYGGGVGGIAIPYLKKVARWDATKRADLTFIGHLHQQRDFGHAMCNGSLVGYGCYSEFIGGEAERPQQTFYLIDERHGKTVVAPIILEDK